MKQDRAPEEKKKKKKSISPFQIEAGANICLPCALQVIKTNRGKHTCCAASAALSRTQIIPGDTKTLLIFLGGDEAAAEEGSAGRQSPRPAARRCLLLVEFAPLKTLPEVSGCGILKFSIFPGVETSSFSNPSLVITRPETTKCSKRALGAGQHVLFCRGEAGRGGTETRWMAARSARHFQPPSGLQGACLGGKMRIQTLFPALGMQQEAETQSWGRLRLLPPHEGLFFWFFFA